MPLIVRTKLGLESALRVASALNDDIWCGSDVLTQVEHRSLLARGRRVTRFTFSLQGECAARMKDAEATVREHHPGLVIWAETLLSY